MVETIRFLAAISLGKESAMATESPPLNPPQVRTLMVLASNFLNVPIMSIGPADPNKSCYEDNDNHDESNREVIDGIAMANDNHFESNKDE